MARDRRQAQRDVEVLIDVTAGRFHFLRLPIAFQRLTAAARTVSCLPRLRGRIKKFHVLGALASGWGMKDGKDSSRFHRINKGPSALASCASTSDHF